MKTTREIIRHAFRNYRPVLAFSGGGDSAVLLDIVTEMGYRPPLVFADSQMEYPATVEHVKAQAEKYNLPLTIAKAEITPHQNWQKNGYPMLGKMAARLWMQKHRGAKDAGFKIDVSTCCRKMKIAPAREAIHNLSCNANMTGQRGGEDDQLRGLREFKEGAIRYLKTDDLTVINPLLGWTDTMVARYTEAHNLPIHPLKAQGALTIGCIYCGGGAQFDNSGFRVLRHTDPAAFRRMLVEYDFAPIIISIRYDCHIDTARAAIEACGGTEQLIKDRPHVFDFLRHKPLKGYAR